MINRYLTIVRNGFSGTPTLLRENTSIEQLNASCDTSDILYVQFYHFLSEHAKG